MENGNELFGPSINQGEPKKEQETHNLPAQVEIKEIEALPAEMAVSTFGDKTSFEHGQRVARMLASSDLIPDAFKGNVQNVMIALEMANRIGASPLMVMQNLYIVHGKPSWSSSFIISAINSSGKFSPLRFERDGEGESLSCYCWAYDLKNQEKCIGPKVTYKMAIAEGWVGKKGSKWVTLPELMIMYRSAAFFGRLFAPEIMMGMQTAEEVQDIQVLSSEQKQDNINSKLKKIF